MNFPIEVIPDNSFLFYRIHKTYIDTEVIDAKRKIKPAAFDPQPRLKSVEMSVDWDKYSTALETRNRARNPEMNGVVSFETSKVRQTPPLKVEHKPSNNRAHSIIFDVLPNANDPEIRIKLRKICSWVIEINTMPNTH